MEVNINNRWRSCRVRAACRKESVCRRCHPDDTGAFNTVTYQSMVQLTAWLCNRFGLTSQDVIRHYDVTGKICPKYFVEHEDAWEQFKADVQQQIGVLAS